MTFKLDVSIEKSLLAACPDPLPADLNIQCNVASLAGGLLNWVYAREIGIIWSEEDLLFIHPSIPKGYSLKLPDFAKESAAMERLADENNISLDRSSARMPEMRCKAIVRYEQPFGGFGGPDDVVQYAATAGEAILRAFIEHKTGPSVLVPVEVWKQTVSSDSQQSSQPERQRG